MSAATLTARVIIYCLRPTAKTLLIVTFIFGACSCAIRCEIRPRHIAIPWRLSRPRGSYLPDACDMQGRHAPLGPSLPSKQREACKTTERGRWYCRIFRYARWLARKENLSKGREETDILKSNDMFRKGCETSQFYRLYMRLQKRSVFLSSWISLDSKKYYWRLWLENCDKFKVYPAKGAYQYLLQAPLMVGQNCFSRELYNLYKNINTVFYIIRVCYM